MRALANALNRQLWMLWTATIAGVIVTTSSVCGASILLGPDMSCALPFIWLVGIPIALLSTLVFGLPVALLLKKFHLFHWREHAIAGLLCAMPCWIRFVHPFESAAPMQSGIDVVSRFTAAVIVLGSGLTSGLAYWWICRSRQR